MINFKNKVQVLLTKRQMTIEALCSEIGMSRQNLSLIFKKESLETKHLEKIAEVLKVSVGYFFEDVENKGVVNSSNTISLEMALKEIEHLKQRLQDKETEIKLKDEIINLLKKK